MDPLDLDSFRLEFLKHSRSRDQQSIFQFCRRIEKLDEQDLTSILDSCFESSISSTEYLNLFVFYRSLLMKKVPMESKMAKKMEDFHIIFINGCQSDYPIKESLRLSLAVLKNINLAFIEGYFNHENVVFNLKKTLLDTLRIFKHEEADDRHLIQFYTESVKLLRNLKMRHAIPGVLIQIRQVLSARPSMVSCFGILTDMEDVKPRTAFIENHPDDLVPLLSLLIIHATLAILSSDIGIKEFSFFEFNDGIYPLFFKIFATDTDAMYEVLNLMLSRQLTGPLNPVKFYSVMVHGAIDGRSFYENHIHRNPDGMQFTFSVLKSINQNRLDVDEDTWSTESYALHLSLRDHFLDLLEEDALEFNPTPYLKQLNLYLKQ